VGASASPGVLFRPFKGLQADGMGFLDPGRLAWAKVVRRFRARSGVRVRKAILSLEAFGRVEPRAKGAKNPLDDMLLVMTARTETMQPSKLTKLTRPLTA